MQNDVESGSVGLFTRSCMKEAQHNGRAEAPPLASLSRPGKPRHMRNVYPRIVPPRGTAINKKAGDRNNKYSILAPARRRNSVWCHERGKKTFTFLSGPARAARWRSGPNVRRGDRHLESMFSCAKSRGSRNSRPEHRRSLPSDNDLFSIVGFGGVA